MILIRLSYIYQNASWNDAVHVPLNKINNKSTEAYLVPKWAKYGLNDSKWISMDSDTVKSLLTGHTGFISRI